MTDYTIRQALPNSADAAGIHHVEQISLGDSPYGAEHLLTVLADPTHHTWVCASNRGELVGFCDCFVTRQPELCLEIDLLGVLPEARHQGLARQMLRQAIAHAASLSIHKLRALVAEDNIASQRAFAGAGLTPRPGLFTLLLCETGSAATTLERLTPTRPQPAPINTPQAIPLERLTLSHGTAWADVLCVRTISYEGLWIERLSSENEDALVEILRQTVARAQSQALDEVGRVCPAEDYTEQSAALFRAGFSQAGTYYVFSD